MEYRSATLKVDLAALRSNYRLLQSLHAKKNIAAVVKANAYGLGVQAVARAFWEEGCREFFVATLAEAVELRGYLPQAKIASFGGVFSGEEKEFLAYNIRPVLNDIGMIERAGAPDAIVHVDTGMTRLGLSQRDVETLAQKGGFRCDLLMSHLSCANEPGHAKNAEQLQRFQAALHSLQASRASLANSSGLHLAADFHFDLGRPGCALYGINPVAGKNPMAHVATLSAPILQIRDLDRDEAVGYGATYPATRGGKIAVVALGYADGYFRSLSNQGFAYIAGQKVPIAGRVSMDMIALDVTAVYDQVKGAREAEFINAQQPVDAVANAVGTIGYEVFTRIGRRVVREYV